MAFPAILKKEKMERVVSDADVPPGPD